MEGVARGEVKRKVESDRWHRGGRRWMGVGGVDGGWIVLGVNGLGVDDPGVVDAGGLKESGIRRRGGCGWQRDGVGTTGPIQSTPVLGGVAGRWVGVVGAAVSGVWAACGCQYKR